jgi:hypothetical protein
MDDRFLHDQRRDPDPAFARGLRERLGRDEGEAPEHRFRLAPALAAAAAVAVVAGVVFLPSVRAAAQGLLDFFRVRNFAAVEFDPARIERLRATQNDPAMFVFDRKEVLQDPGPRQTFATVPEAAAAAGLLLRAPAELPSGLALDRVEVQGEARARFTANTARLRALLDALDLRDVEVPRELDGATVAVHLQPVVAQVFRKDKLEVSLMQSMSPEVDLPAGAEPERLGEIGLRILGLDAGEARRFARSVDWRNTLVVPVPAGASAFREVTVGAGRGLLVTTRERADGRERHGALLLWADGDRVFALAGNLAERELLLMAESVR